VSSVTLSINMSMHPMRRYLNLLTEDSGSGNPEAVLKVGPLTFDQAKFRIRSFHGVRARYHFLIAQGTVDEDLYSVVSNKTSFAHHIIDKYRRNLTPEGDKNGGSKS